MPIPSQPTTNMSLGPSLGPTNRSISVEHGGSPPFSMNAYRRGNLVADHPINASIPTTASGTRNMSNYNGSSIVLRYTIAANTQNFNLLTYATSPSRVGTTKSQGYINDGKYTAGQPGYGIEVVINPGVTIGSASGTQSAFVTGVNEPTTGWHPTVQIVIRNAGNIVGAGGAGGSFSPAVNGRAQPLSQPGFSGGTAIDAQRAVVIINGPEGATNSFPGGKPAGTFAGGGGGGGAGEPVYDIINDPKGFPQDVWAGGGGGGGGAGTNTAPNTGGAGGAAVPVNIFNAPLGQQAVAGQAGTRTAGGQGGIGYRSFGGPPGPQAQTFHPFSSGTGGAGGAIATAGSAGTARTVPAPSVPSLGTPFGGSAGGAAGFYAVGNPNITWQGTPQGTRQGQVS